MVDRTNQIMVLGDDEKYIVLKQFNFPDATYYYTDKLSKDEETPLEEFMFFKNVEENSLTYMAEVTDASILEELNKKLNETE